MSQSSPSSSSPLTLQPKQEQNTYSSLPTNLAQPAVPQTSSTWQIPAHWSKIANTAALIKKINKNTQRTVEEIAQSARIAARVAERLQSDQAAATTPDVDTPFVDAVDVLNRLLPYHVFQQPAEDLQYISKDKGKRKATDDDLRDEIRDTKFALECFKRRAKLEKRFREIRTKAGQRTAPDDQAVCLAQSVLDSDRAETALMNTELRSLRNEYDRIERERKAAATTQRPTYYQPVATTVPTTFNRSYYHAYNPYTYAPTTYAPAVQSAGVTSFSVPLSGTSTPTSAAPAVTSNFVSTANHTIANAPATTSPPATATPTVATAASTTSTPTPFSYNPTVSGAVPVQLPVSALPALQSLGIIPVTAVNQGQEPAAAVLRSATGTVLNMDINVSMLKPHQMQGLSIILNSLMTRSNQESASSSSGS